MPYFTVTQGIIKKISTIHQCKSGVIQNIKESYTPINGVITKVYNNRTYDNIIWNEVYPGSKLVDPDYCTENLTAYASSNSKYVCLESNFNLHTNDNIILTSSVSLDSPDGDTGASGIEFQLFTGLYENETGENIITRCNTSVWGTNDYKSINISGTVDVKSNNNPLKLCLYIEEPGDADCRTSINYINIYINDNLVLNIN